MTTKTTQRPRVGDELWEVEWRAEPRPDDEEPRYRRRNLPTREDAFRFARENFSLTEPGGEPLMMITHYRFEPYDDGSSNEYAGFWEAAKEPECYEGEE